MCTYLCMCSKNVSEACATFISFSQACNKISKPSAQLLLHVSIGGRGGLFGLTQSNVDARRVFSFSRVQTFTYPRVKKYL